MENKIENVLDDNFCHLHVHSTYSFQEAIGLPHQYSKVALELGQKSIAITDMGNISSHYKWYKEMNKNGIKPILGCEFFLILNKQNIFSKQRYHITVLAKNLTGYRNLTKLVTKAWCEQFYYKPQITIEDLEQHQEGLIILSGDSWGIIIRNIINHNEEEAEKLLLRMAKSFSDFYVEITPTHNYNEEEIAYKKLIILAKKHLIPMVVTNDCHFIKKESSNLHEILLCIQAKDKMDNENRFTYSKGEMYLKTRKEMEEALKENFPDEDFTEALDNTVKIANSVDFKFPSAKPLSYPMEDHLKPQKLRELCEEGLKLRASAIKQEEMTKYRERMEYELDLINKKNFIDYFLVISDLIIWAKERGILVGPGRGSAAGSLVCWLTRITEVDPLRYDLIFERFIDINREDLPDIDIDFEDARRWEVKKYLTDKYGQEKVGNLPTFAFFKSKNCIDDIGRVFKIPFKVLEEIKKLVIERSGGDSRASFTLEDTFSNPLFEYPKKAMEKYPELKYTIQLEGQIRQMGQHAAGFVISNENITDFCAIYKIKDEHVLSMDYKDITSIGLLKIDLLGLNTLTVISNSVKMIKERTGTEIDMYKLEFDDKKVYKGFLQEKLFGIFQFDGQAVNQVCRQIKPNDFSSLYDISALARPGPLNSGSATMYIERRAKRKKVDYPHALMEPFTKDTYGIVIYQEQVMRTMRDIGKMSWKDTAEIRKAISKSQGLEAFNRYKEGFAIGAKENGMTDKEIDTMWDSICTFGSWAFNKSHSVSYTMISYWTMYLKVYYPMEFYSSILSIVNSDDKKKKIIKEYKKEKYKILGVDVNKSKESFAIDGDAIRIGFGDISGIGDAVCKNIIKNQPYDSYEDFINKTQGKKVTERTSKSLIELGAFDSLPQSTSLDLFGNHTVLYKKQGLEFAERFKLCPWDVEFNIKSKWREFYIRNKSKLFNQFPVPIETLKEKEGYEDVVIWGIAYDKNLRDKKEVSLSKGKKAVTFKEGELTQFCNFIVEDDTDFMTVRLSPKIFPRFGNLLFERVKEDDVIVMKGKMGSGIRMFFCNEMICLKELKKQLGE